MLDSCASTLSKEERLCSKKLIDELFGGGCSKSMMAYPIRVVYVLRPHEDGEPQIRVLMSVSKRYFKHAVQRNRIKRQLREAYRKNKSILFSPLSDEPSKELLVAFLWVDGNMHDSQFVEKQVCDLLNRIKERI
jgi:ribonuclease P protein component